MQLPIWHVDAFARRPFRGNPAAVCILTDWLDDATMQSIAAENALSETAFCVRDRDIWRLRWLTPRVEVDLCGHATLASAWVIMHDLEPGVDEVRFETRSGLLTVRRVGDLLAMDLPASPPRPCAVPDRVVRALGCAPQTVLGSASWLLVYANEAEVRGLAPEFAGLRDLEREGVIVTAPGDDVDFVSRYFVPDAGIDEDPVTGAAHCVSAPYWAERLGKRRLRARQVSTRGGDLGCEVTEHGRVVLEGTCAPYLRGTILLPDPA